MLEIIGKNGAGKSYLANKLYEMGFKKNVGVTTRPMRYGEINGIDYFFITEKEFEDCIKNNQFVDYKMRNGYYYGILGINIDENTILVSGDTKKIEIATGYDISKLYIESDLLIRYSRVLKRNDLMQNVFNRFHIENFSYLYDFDALFINNDFVNNEALERITNIITNNQNIQKNMISNRKFIEFEVNRFDIEQIRGLNDKLLMLLKFEEYLLRCFFLENDDLFKAELIEKYYETLSLFMEDNNICYRISDNQLYANIGSEEYKFNYKIKRKVIL